MKKILYLFSILYGSFYFSQMVSFTEVKGLGKNNDKFLYALTKEPDSASARYLAQIEISGFSADDEAVFMELYKKAKSVSGNYYYIKSPENMEGEPLFNPNHYTLYIYDANPSKIKNEENAVYLINSGKDVEVKINNRKINLQERSYIKYNLSSDNITDISVGKFLGSRIKLQSKSGQPEQYFQISGKKISANSSSVPGINFKTGDIIGLEKSFAGFLISVYQEKQIK